MYAFVTRFPTRMMLLRSDMYEAICELCVCFAVCPSSGYVIFGRRRRPSDDTSCLAVSHRPVCQSFRVGIATAGRLAFRSNGRDLSLPDQLFAFFVGVLSQCFNRHIYLFGFQRQVHNWCVQIHMVPLFPARNLTSVCYRSLLHSTVQRTKI